MLLGSIGLAVIYTVMGFCYQNQVKGWPMLLLVLAAIGLLCHVAGAGGLGGDFGNFPQSHSRGGHVRVRRLAVDRLFPSDLYVSDTEQKVGAGEDFLDLRGDMRGRDLCSSKCSFPKPKAKPSNKLKKSWWTDEHFGLNTTGYGEKKRQGKTPCLRW